MPDYRSKTSTAGRNMAGARALWRATGMKDDDFNKLFPKINEDADQGAQLNQDIEDKLLWALCVPSQ